MNPPSQAEKLKQELRRRVIQGVSGMQTRAYSHTEATNEIMTAIADYISGIELPKRMNIDSPEMLDKGFVDLEYVAHNNVLRQVETTLKDIEKELRK